jgi:dephospho-CoA kinase
VSRYIVGVSGGIGSGKSAVAEQFARCGAAVVDTDHVAHALTAAGGAAMPIIRQAFGDEVLLPDGALDRAAMRRRVFSHSEDRQRLESLLHPLIRAESAQRCAAAEAPYVLLLIPLLAETMAVAPYTFLDRVLIVDCDEATQLARVMQRNGLSESEVNAIMATQASRATRRALADDVIVNNGALNELESQICALHQRYKVLAKAKVKATC